MVGEPCVLFERLRQSGEGHVACISDSPWRRAPTQVCHKRMQNPGDCCRDVEIQEGYTRRAVRVAQMEENETTMYLKIMGDKLEALLGEIKDCEQRNHWAARWESTSPNSSPCPRPYRFHTREAKSNTFNPVSTRNLTESQAIHPGRYNPFPVGFVCSLTAPLPAPCLLLVRDTRAGRTA